MRALGVLAEVVGESIRIRRMRLFAAEVIGTDDEGLVLRLRLIGPDAALLGGARTFVPSRREKVPVPNDEFRW